MMHLSRNRRCGIVKVAAAGVASAMLWLAGECPAQSAPPAASQPATPAYELVFSTFFGSAADCRGMCVDAQGNAYLGAATWWQDKLKAQGLKDGWVTTEGAYDRTHHGDADMAISKWSPEGKLVWSTLIGGPGHDRPYAIKADGKGFVYFSGRGGKDFPVTPDSFQQVFNGTDQGIYGLEGSVTGKMTPDGSKIVWAAYLGGRDMTLDDEGNIYITLGASLAGRAWPESWFANAYCKKPNRAKEDTGIIKVSNDGKKVIWATFAGGTGGNFGSASLCVGPDHCPLLFIPTDSKDLPTTPGTFSQKPGTGWLGKFSADGSKLIFGTYIPGTGAGSRTHDVALDSQGNVFIGTSLSGNWPATPGAFQTKYGGGKGDYAIAKLSPEGKLLAATYLGGSGDEINGPDTISVNQKTGEVLLTGGFALNSRDYPVTNGCLQPKHGGGPSNGVLSVLSNDLTTLIYSTYMGGSGGDNLRANGFCPDGSFWVAGFSQSPDFPTKNAYQAALKEVGGKPVNALVLAKFKPATAANDASAK